MTLREWCRANWNKIPEDMRKKCVDHLASWIPEGDILRMKANGYDDGWFHFSAGMQIRNKLREVLTDDQLPVITRSLDGSPYGAKNWDDYYTGALDELLERY